MLSAVHTDRTGRVFVSAECTAAGSDGVATVPLERGIPLPADARLVPLAREAEGLDRHGRVRGLGRDRWALGAVLPPGHLRTLHPAYRVGAEPLTSEPCAAVGADEHGSLVAAALVIDAEAVAQPVTEPAALAARIAAALREDSGNRLLRQLARCARESACADARAIFLGAGTGALPVAPAATAALATRRGIERAGPAEPAAFRPSAEEIAAVAIRHLERGAGMVSFGRACDGEPLASVRLVEDAIARIRAATRRGTIHLETDGTHPQALRRVLSAGLDAVTVRLEEGSAGSRRESLLVAAGAGAALSVAVLACPGRTDAPEALAALQALLGALPGGLLILRDGADDPRSDARPAGAGAPIGIAAAIERLARDAPHFRTAAFARPLVAA